MKGSIRGRRQLEAAYATAANRSGRSGRLEQEIIGLCAQGAQSAMSRPMDVRQTEGPRVALVGPRNARSKKPQPQLDARNSDGDCWRPILWLSQFATGNFRDIAIGDICKKISASAEPGHMGRTKAGGGTS